MCALVTGVQTCALPISPGPVLAYVGRQLGVSPEAFADYAHRDQTRREHPVDIRRSHGFRAFDRQAFREIVAFSIPIAQTISRPARKSVVAGKRASVRVIFGGCRYI